MSDGESQAGRPAGGFGAAARRRIRKTAGLALLAAARRLTRLGERVGSERLIYNVLAQYGFLRSARHAAPRFSAALREVFPDVRSVVDVGCGPGVFVAQFDADGMKAVGVEYSPRLRAQARRRGATVHSFDVAGPTPPPPGGPFDLAFSSEVAEHIAPELADAFVAYFAGLADRVVFTAARPGQGGTGHLNEQPVQYWREKFANAGFAFDPEATGHFAAALRSSGIYPYLAANLSVFRRTEPVSPTTSIAAQT